MSIIPIEYPKPENVYDAQRRTFLARRPLPWHTGEQHESRCDVRDAGGGLVCTINGPDAVIVAGRMLAALNAMAPYERGEKT